MDERRVDGGDRQLVGGSGENFERSASKEEETVDRTPTHNTHLCNTV